MAACFSFSSSSNRSTTVRLLLLLLVLTTVRSVEGLSGCNVTTTVNGVLRATCGSVIGTVCRSRFTTEMAAQHCRSIHGSGYHGWYTLGSNYTGTIFDISCSSSITALSQCSFYPPQSSCSHGQDVNIVCALGPAPTTRSGCNVGTNAEGLLRVTCGSTTGTVCDAYFHSGLATRHCEDTRSDAFSGWFLSGSSETGGTIYEIDCSRLRDEFRLSSCLFTPTASCSHSQDVLLQCLWTPGSFNGQTEKVDPAEKLTIVAKAGSVFLSCLLVVVLVLHAVKTCSTATNSNNNADATAIVGQPAATTTTTNAWSQPPYPQQSGAATADVAAADDGGSKDRSMA